MSEIDLPNADVDVEGAVDPNVSADESESGAANPVVESPFSKWDGAVNERTKFKDIESLKKSFDESGQRIAQLSAYEKTAKRYGITEAQQLSGLFDELIASRAAKDAAAKAPKVESKAEPEATKEQKDVREFLAKELPGLGFVTKEKLEALEAKLQELQQGNSQSQEVRAKSLVKEGQKTVAGFLKEAKIDDPKGKRALMIETLIRADIENDPEMGERFWEGGPEMQALLKERYDEAMEYLGWKSSEEATKPNASAAHALSKGKQIVANKKLPAADSARTGAPEAKARQTSGKRDYISELHEKAAKVFQESMG